MPCTKTKRLKKALPEWPKTVASSSLSVLLAQKEILPSLPSAAIGKDVSVKVTRSLAPSKDKE